VRLYEHAASANCLKCRVLLRQLGLPFESVEVDLFRGDARRPPHLARNPDGRVPVLETDAGDLVPESGAILLYLAEGTPLLPAGRLARARVHQWMFFEQNHIEPELASARFMALTGRAEREPEVFAAKVAAGRRSLESVARGLADGRPFLCGDDYTVADIALHAYVHCAGDAGADPAEHPAVKAWLRRVEATPEFVNDLAPIPPHAMLPPA
jgi:glutathione S-transferase